MNVKDQQDIFSFSWVGYESAFRFAFSTRILNDLYTRKPNGNVELHLDTNEDIVLAVDTIKRLFHTARGAWDRTENLLHTIRV